MEEFKLAKSMKHIITYIEKDINIKLKQKDLSFSQGVILVKISKSENGETPLKKLEEKFDVAQSTMFGVISRLEKKGLVQTYLSKNKIKIAKITEEGKDLIDFIVNSIKSTENNMFTGFSIEERFTFIELLKKIEDNTEYHKK